MIEFTILELTLLALCAALFFRNMQNSLKLRAMSHLVDAMCDDEDLLNKLRQHRNEIRESV